MRLKIFEGTGNTVISFIHYMGDLTLFTFSAFRQVFKRPLFFPLIVRQIMEIGIRSFPLIAISSFAIGIVMSMHSIRLLKQFGAVHYVAAAVGLSIVKELGPVLTALMVSGRSGSGISAEIGSMRVTRQIDALQVLAVNPMKYLVVTRILACMISVPLLTAFADVIGIGGGLLMGVTAGGISPNLYLDITFEFVEMVDLIPAFFKACFFGFLIGVISTYGGFRASGGTSGVGLATTRTVVVTSLMIFISDIFLSQAFILLFGA
jgi:phospholipid/cholesterol/gamma-HCH transport system permease protein